MFHQHHRDEAPALHEVYTMDKFQRKWRFVPDSYQYQTDFENKIRRLAIEILRGIEKGIFQI
jgi:hypothetical protein